MKCLQIFITKQVVHSPKASCFNQFLVSAEMQVDVQLDRLKLKGTKRAHFVQSKDSKQTVNVTVPNTNQLTCQDLEAFVIVSN